MSVRTFFVLICSFALVCAARGETEHKKETSDTKSSQHVATHAEHPTGDSTHVQRHPQAPQRPATAGGNPPAGGGAVMKPTGPESYPGTAPAGNTAAKPATSAPPVPVYHYNFPTKSGLIGRDFTKPLTPEEQSTIAREIEKGQPEGTKAAPGGYQYDNGVYHYNFPTKSGLIGRDFTKPLTPEEQSAIAREIEKGQPKGTQVRPGVVSTQAKVNPLRPQHFNLPSKPDPAIAGVKFEGTGHIPGSETWTDPKYAAFRDYHHEWHDKEWWDTHLHQGHPVSSPAPKPSPAGPKPSPAGPKPSPAGPKPSASPNPSPSPKPSPSPTPPPITIVLVFGGYYFRDGCYWYPAWGYDPAYSYYPYDGPIYSCGLPPDQVIADVQVALQALGYYDGPMNGLLGPETRAAIAAYQRDNQLYMTSAIDEPTLTSLGIG